jgi:hypothetical protein
VGPPGAVRDSAASFPGPGSRSPSLFPAPRGLPGALGERAGRRWLWWWVGADTSRSPRLGVGRFRGTAWFVVVFEEVGDLDSVVGQDAEAAPGLGPGEPVDEGPVPAVVVLEVGDLPLAAGAPLDQAAEGPSSFDPVAGGAGSARVGNGDTGAVADNVELAERGRGCREHRLDLGALGDVGVGGEAAVAESLGAPPPRSSPIWGTRVLTRYASRLVTPLFRRSPPYCRRGPRPRH